MVEEEGKPDRTGQHQEKGQIAEDGAASGRAILQEQAVAGLVKRFLHAFECCLGLAGLFMCRLAARRGLLLLGGAAAEVLEQLQAGALQSARGRLAELLFDLRQLAANGFVALLLLGKPLTQGNRGLLGCPAAQPQFPAPLEITGQPVHMLDDGTRAAEDVADGPTPQRRPRDIDRIRFLTIIRIGLVVLDFVLVVGVIGDGRWRRRSWRRGRRRGFWFDWGRRLGCWSRCGRGLCRGCRSIRPCGSGRSGLACCRRWRPGRCCRRLRGAGSRRHRGSGKPCRRLRGRRSRLRGLWRRGLRSCLDGRVRFRLTRRGCAGRLGFHCRRLSKPDGRLRNGLRFRLLSWLRGWLRFGLLGRRLRAGLRLGLGWKWRMVRSRNLIRLRLRRDERRLQLHRLRDRLMRRRRLRFSGSAGWLLGYRCANDYLTRLHPLLPADRQDHVRTPDMPTGRQLGELRRGIRSGFLLVAGEKPLIGHRVGTSERQSRAAPTTPDRQPTARVHSAFAAGVFE